MFTWWENIVSYLVYTQLALEQESKFAQALHFFIYDTVKIYILLVTIIFVVSLFRTYFPVEKVRAYLQGKHKLVGHVSAAFFGMLTPFCSCSAIPLFLGFLQARIPLGITFSYLISAPLSDAVVIALLFSLFGWKITLMYIASALLIAIIAGLIIGRLNLEKEILITIPPSSCCQGENGSVDFNSRLNEAWGETKMIFQKIYLYVIIGIGIGAFIHGYIPSETIVKYAGGDAWYGPIMGVLMGIPMYSSAAGMIPLIEVLTSKGMLLGTALSFMMAVVALSLPEAMILKKVMSLKLISIFLGTVGTAILIVGYVFNTIL